MNYKHTLTLVMLCISMEYNETAFADDVTIKSNVELMTDGENDDWRTKWLDAMISTK
ncbi:hypothetical protein [Vibrio campbellii]|uniref:hypothetical protein n=1 Tax=Vibrio campbellii TaxID=680 RepID=UPI0013629FDB|nr:hypothetical protein [Vibrio campbellii]